MARQVITARDLDRPADGAGAPTPMADAGGPAAPAVSIAPITPDGYTSRLVKYIPSEVIALYLTVAGVLATQDPVPTGLSIGVLVLITIMTPVYLARIEGVTKKRQLILSTICFLVWALALGQPPFSVLEVNPLYGALALPIFTFTLPIWDAPRVTRLT